MFTIQHLFETVNNTPQFAIYGAQVVAYGVFTALRELRGAVPECFIVSVAGGNPAQIEGIPVTTLDGCCLPEDTLILVAVTELLQDEICSALDACGYRNCMRIGAHEEHRLMSAYFDSIGLFPLLEETRADTESYDTNGGLLLKSPAARDSDPGDDMPDLVVFEAKNHRDKPLAAPPSLKPWERTIQAGADVTDMRIAPLLDNTGENISHKNKMYSEMTATYWVWKNTSYDWKGICHYRRHLVLSPGQIARLAGGNTDGGGTGSGGTDCIDALLPLPYICYPDTLSQFGRFVSPAVVDVLLDSLKALHPGNYEQYYSLLSGKYQYTYNLLVARRNVFDSYCAWAFEVLGHMERSTGTVPEIASTRALSYAAEVVTSLYFLSNSDRLSIRHIAKSIYV